tara:strand:+ start:10191 stop:10628 length:438 start_codon:yes stop_codon:yes gene_type:complete
MAKKKISEIREEPGMSNAGKYPNVAKEDFCGPNGTYPVNTLKRAKSALKLAHNAGRRSNKIKACVYAKYPQLKPSEGASMSNKQHAKNLLDKNPVVDKSKASAEGKGGAAMNTKVTSKTRSKKKEEQERKKIQKRLETRNFKPER